jgi:hypothetical protein
MNALFALPILAAVPMPIVALAEPYPCPETLAVAENVTAVPDGWRSVTNQDHHSLAGVSLSEGDPADQATLVPTSNRKQGKTIVATWALPPSKAGYWLACLYTGTGMALAKPLPAGVKSCRVESDAATDPPSPTKIDCR